MILSRESKPMDNTHLAPKTRNPKRLNLPLGLLFSVSFWDRNSYQNYCKHDIGYLRNRMILGILQGL